MSAKTVWLLVLVSAMTYSCVAGSGEAKTETSVFCAYGKLFVEFKEHHNVWGTIFLDSDGRPIPCDDNKGVRPTPKNTLKEII